MEGYGKVNTTLRSKNKMYDCCVRHNFFTRGSNDQYQDMFDMVDDPNVSIVELAAVVWICSEGYTRDEVLNILRKEIIR